MDSIRDTMLVAVALLVTMTGCSDSSGPTGADSGTSSARITSEANPIPGENTTPGLEAPAPADVEQATDAESWDNTGSIDTPVDEPDWANNEDATGDADYSDVYDGEEYADDAGVQGSVSQADSASNW